MLLLLYPNSLEHNKHLTFGIKSNVWKIWWRMSILNETKKTCRLIQIKFYLVEDKIGYHNKQTRWINTYLVRRNEIKGFPYWGHPITAVCLSVCLSVSLFVRIIWFCLMLCVGQTPRTILPRGLLSGSYSAGEGLVVECVAVSFLDSNILLKFSLFLI